MTTNQFTALISDYDSSLRSFALKFTRDEDDANDLIQDTMMKAFRYMDRYQDGTNLKGWLYTIMRNTFINNYRKSSRTGELITQSEELSSVQLSTSSAKNAAEGAFVLGDIQGALSNLAEHYRIPFVRYVEGYKYEEIAAELSIPLGTVKTRIHEARRILSRKLQMYKEKVN
jgi:RNA polymerase sigma factor (sigma-70 family)